MYLRKKVKRFIASMLTVIVTASGLSTEAIQVRASQPEKDNWEEVQEILSGIVGRYTEAPEKNLVESNAFTAGMLLGNGKFGVVSDAREDEQSFYLSGQDVWDSSKNQKIMNAQLQITPAEKKELKITANDEKKGESKGVNAVIDGNPLTYWITNAQSDKPGDKWLLFDFGKDVTIDCWSSTHRGYMDVNEEGVHNVRYNTRNFSLQISEDKENWIDIDTITDNEDYQVDRNLDQPVKSRYFRIYITKPVQPGAETAKVENDRATARISEVDFSYQGKSVIHEEEQKAAGFRYNNSDGSGFHGSAQKAFDDNEVTMWRSDTQAIRVDGKTIPHDKWVSISREDAFTFDKIEIKHNGVNFPDETMYNTYDYELQISDDGSTWNSIQEVNGNTESVNAFTFETPVTAKHLRMFITTPVHPDAASKHFENDMTNARISDINLYYKGKNVVVPERESGEYYHEQDILNAEVRSRQEFNGEWVTFKSWVADDRNYLITNVTLDETAAEQLKLKLLLTSPKGYSPKTGTSENLIYLTRESGNTYKSKTATVVRVLKGESEVVENSQILSLHPGETAQILTYAHSSSGFTDGNGIAVMPLDELKEQAFTRITSVEEKDVDAMHEEHLAWWKNYWQKSYVDIDDDVLQRYYFGALYGLGCTMRQTGKGADQPNVPASMMGVWQTNDTCSSYGRGYTNYNYEAPYYGIYSANRGELMEPYYEECVARLTDAQNKAASAGYQGVQFERSITPVYHYYNKKSPKAVAGTKNPSKLPTDQKSNVMLYTQALIWEWMYQRNEETLKKYVYPSIKQTVEFYLDFLVKKEDGKYWVENSANNELNASSSYDINPVLDIGYVKSHFKAFQEMSEYLGENLDMILQIREVLENLSPYPTSENAAVAKQMLAEQGFDDDKEAVVSGYYSDNYDQIKASNSPWGSYIYEGNQPVILEGLVHPAENISLSSNSDELKLAKDTFNYLNPLNPYYRGGGYNGFPKSFTIGARLGLDGDYLLQRLDTTIQTIWRENLTCNNGGAHGIESFGTIEAVNSMLLQNENEEMRLFPSWAKNTSAKFVDLRAKGAFLVSSEYNAATQKVSYINLTSQKGNDVNLVSPWENGVVIRDSSGITVDAEMQMTENTGELLFHFKTVAGETYQITENSHPLGEVEKIHIELEEKELYVNGTIQAKVIVEPETAGGLIKWSSSEPGIATVNQKGVITAVAEGSTVITAESLLIPGKKDSVTVLVKEKRPESIYITGIGDGTLQTQEEKKLAVTFTPEQVTNQEVIWESSNPDVLSVQDSGMIKGISYGTATVTATSKADESVKASVDLQVLVDSNGYAALLCDLKEATIENGSTLKRSYVMGYNFKVRNPITISALGFYDQNKDGVFSNAESQIAIWNQENGEMVAEGFVTKGTVSDQNGYCYATLKEPVTINQGTYVIAGIYHLNSKDSWFHSFKEKPFTTGKQVEYLFGGYFSSELNQEAEFDMPSPSEDKNYFYCLNFKYLDKNALRDCITEIEGYQPDNYTEEDWNLLQLKKEKARSIVENKVSDQNKIEEALFNLQMAVKGLIELSTDTSTLSAFYETVTQMDLSGYTKESVEKLQLAMKAVAEVLNDEKPTGRELERVQKEMLVSMVNLEKAVQEVFADTFMLEILCEEYGGLDFTLYTEESLSPLIESIQKAEALLRKEDATQDAVNQASANLILAAAGLREKIREKIVVEEKVIEKVIEKVVEKIVEKPADSPLKKNEIITKGGLKYKVTTIGEGKETVSVVGAAKKSVTRVNIPSTVTLMNIKCKVTAVKEKAFYKYRKLKKVTVGSNVTRIGRQAFFGASKLKTVTLRTKKLKIVGSKAFKGIYKTAVIYVPKGKRGDYVRLLKNKGQKKEVKIIVDAG